MASQIKSDIILRVFRIYVGNNSGTCFTLEHNHKQFLITAKHLFENAAFPNNISIGILQNHQRVDIDCYSYYCDGNIDIAVLEPKNNLLVSKMTPVEFGVGGVTFGEEAFFLGYPLDYDATLMNLPSTANPIPFVKKCCVSCFLENDLIALDGINNPGFSGAPVFRVENKKTIVFGVIKGYRFNASTVYKIDGAQGIQTDMFIKENTGIVYAYSIKKAIDLLNEKYPASSVDLRNQTIEKNNND